MKKNSIQITFGLLLISNNLLAQYSMSEFEKGSNAVLQMQKNAIQSQNIKQNNENDLQAKRNELQLQQLEIEKLTLQLEAIKQAQEIARLKAENNNKNKD